MVFSCHVCCGGESVEDAMECPVCHHAACLPCYQRWIISRPQHDACCIYCRHPLSMDLLYRTMPRDFITGDFSAWRGRYLFEREKQLFVQDMDAVAVEMERRALCQSLRSLLSRKRSVTRGKAKNLDRVPPALTKAIAEVRRALRTVSSPTPRVAPRQRRVPLMPCPGSCRGFVMTQDFQCALCRAKVCQECLVPLGQSPEPHDCVSEDRASALAILRDTKACPQCAVRIHKISGCDQMWCVHCHCTFSWETLRVQSVGGPVHNPHYFEWLSEHHDDDLLQAVHQDPQLWGDLLRAVHQDLRLVRNEEGAEAYRILCRTVRTLNHLRHVVMTEHYLPTHEETENRKLRHAFLLNDCTRNDMERLLWKREKRILKKRACHDIIDKLCVAMENRLWKFYREEYHWGQFGNVVHDLKRIVDDACPTFDEVTRAYGGTVHGLVELEAWRTAVSAVD